MTALRAVWHRLSGRAYGKHAAPVAAYRPAGRPVMQSWNTQPLPKVKP